ncbi:hypothetical protein [Brevundimonas sp.]|uniref:hypothetical protein n=1 Tax=Brevundimonas sp. TaxID=1871086 RepID=UPI003F704C95
MSRLALILAIGLSLLASESLAQQTLERSPTTRGRVRDTSVLLAARDAAARAGADCHVTAAALQGRDSFGDRRYEVACREGPGYLIVDGTTPTAYNCLLLESQSERLEGVSSTREVPACLLRANRNPVRHFASVATHAGMDCRVDEGRVVGLSPTGTTIYEIGCRRAPGAWIEQASGAWIVTDCLDIRSRGDLCQFTTEPEELAGFRARLAGSAAEACAPTGVRDMGRNATGLTYYELTCAGGAPVVVSLDAGRRVTNVLTCAEAAHIGDGCRAERSRPER